MMLKKKSLCVCEIVEILQLANSTVSKHLSILRNRDLIIDEKDGRWVNYHLATKFESDKIETGMLQLQELLKNDETVQHDHQLMADVDRFHICGV